MYGGTSNRHNSGPEVDIGERSTVFFTVRRPLGDVIKSFHQGVLKVVKTQKVPRPKIFKSNLTKNCSTDFLQILRQSSRP